MRALKNLRRFILVKCAEGNEHEVREYVLSNLDNIAHAFLMPAETIMSALESVQNDRTLAERFLETIMKGEAILRLKRKEDRARRAHASAEVIGAMAEWHGTKVKVDIVSLLSSALTRRNDMMVFAFDGGSIAVRQSVLFDIARLKRTDLTAFVDSDGLHVMWKSGGLNLYPQSDPKAEKVVVPLPAAPVVVAA